MLVSVTLVDWAEKTQRVAGVHQTKTAAGERLHRKIQPQLPRSGARYVRVSKFARSQRV